MHDSLVIERLELLVLGILLLLNLIVGFSKQRDTSMWPVTTMLMACAVVTIALAIIARQAHMSWMAVYYWRYSYLGPVPLLMPFAYVWALAVWRDGWAIWTFVAAVLIFWLLGWLFNALLVLCGIVWCIYYWLEYREGRQNQASFF